MELTKDMTIMDQIMIHMEKTAMTKDHLEIAKDKITHLTSQNTKKIHMVKTEITTNLKIILVSV
jgi:hypothetical protein